MAIAVTAAPASAQGLPGGASAINETYEDWQVSCAAQEGATYCLFSQNQVDPRSQQRVLTIELALDAGEVAGNLVLPFGLALDEGVTLTVDETPLAQPPRFRTGLPIGCIVPLAFDSGSIVLLREGKTLNVQAMIADGGTETAFAVSLTGFSAALDRTAVLAE